MSNQRLKSMAIALSISVTSYFAVSLANAADLELYMTIKNHTFEPSVLTVPANQRIKLTVHNLDTTPEEFESHATPNAGF